MTNAPPHSPAWIDRTLVRIARFSHANPWRVLVVTFALIACALFATSRLEVRGDFLELLPSGSEGAKLFRGALNRMGGGSATMFVIVESPDADANKRIVDALEPRLRALPRALVRTVEHGPEETRRFYFARRWIFADVGDLEEIECELARARRRAQPGFVDLDDDDSCASLRTDHGHPEPLAPTLGAGAPTPPAPVAGGNPFEFFRQRMGARLRDVDQFPTGYFRNRDGTLFAIVMRSPGTGTGDSTGDALMTRVQAIVRETHAERFHPAAKVGLGGDIPNAIAERESLVEDAVLSTGTAIALILAAIVVFFWSPFALVHIGLAMIAGVSLAYAVAYLAFGYLNMSTAFLGSIIAGNGINYTILYLARYRERRAAGDSVEEALVDASVTCRVGTQLASLAAAGAYGSLMLTSFRGFSQFGLIGGVGMIFCWAATMVVVPASVTAVETLRGRLTGREAPPARPLKTPISNALGYVTTRFAWPIVLAGLALAAVAASKLPHYLQDPWEYNFSRLGSRGSRHSGADQWSTKADMIFTARGGSPDLLLADTFEDVLPLAAALRERDRVRTGGRYVARIETAWDRLGGPPPLVARKLALLAQVREHIDAVMPHLDARDAETAREWRPPEGLRPPTPDELPALVREQFTEKNGRFGTPVFVYYKDTYSPSDGRELMVVAGLTQNIRLPDGRVMPTASRATVFAEMVRSMGVDGPRATLGAFLAVVLIVILATRRARAVAVVLGSLLGGVVLTVGGAAWLDVRLNFLNFVALPLTFGIGVEYAMNLYDRIRHTGGDATAALRSVGGAVTLCSMTTTIGYGALLVADNQALQSFGRYAMAGEIACLVTAMLILPAALRLMPRALPEPAADAAKEGAPS